MLRKTLLTAALAAGLAIPMLAARAQDDGSKDGVRAQVEVRDGRVHVKLRTKDGRTLERELSADELYRRLADRDQDDDVVDNLEHTVRAIPDRLRDAVDSLEKRIPSDGKRGQELEERIEKALHHALDDVKHCCGDRAHVEVDGHKMTVPSRKGPAVLY
jgi:hypothetical protein